jgi:predicted ATPase
MPGRSRSLEREPKRAPPAATPRPHEERPFIGREGVLGAVRRLFADRAPLVSLLGPAGIGKTRLALRYAEAYAAQYPGGVWLCDLSGERSVEAIAGTVTDAIGAALPPDASEEALGGHVGAALAERGELLVVLDDFEGTAAVAAATVGAWMRAAPRAHFLVASRERLRIESELCWFVEPLDLPAEGTADVRTALASEAVRLFVDRAAIAAPGWELEESQVAAVCALVRRLEGSPLAIELAAARMNALGPEQIVERLERRFELLGAPRGDAPVRAALDWSWDLLPPVERVVLVQCAVFRRPFPLEAAEAVVDLTPAIAEGDAPRPIGEVLRTLATGALVVVEGRGAGRIFGMHDAVREFALEKLDVLELHTDATRRHARWLVERARGGALGVGDLAEVLAAHRACVRRTGDADMATLAGELALAAGPLLRGRPQAARALHEQALVAAGRVDPALRARLLVAHADLARLRGDVEGAVSDLAQAAALARELGDEHLGGEVLALRGRVLHDAGRVDEADEAHAQALSLAQRLGDARLEGRVLANWAHTQRARRHPKDALRLATRALEVHRAHGDAHHEADMHAVLGELHHALGELDLASQHLEAARALARAHRMQRLEGVVLAGLGAVSFERGELAEAGAACERAVSLLGAAGDAAAEALASARLGAVLATMDATQEAEACFARADELLLPLSGEDARARAVELERGHVELALARRAEAEGAAEAAAALRATAQRRFTEAQARLESDEERIAARVLERALYRLVPAARGSRPRRPGAPRRA